MTLSAVSEDVRDLLNDNGLGTEGDDLFAFEWGSGDEGEELDEQTLVLDGDSLDTPLKEVYENPTFAIFVRGSKDEGAKAVHDRARAIYEFMIAQPTQTINAIDYLEFEPLGGLLPMGRDANSRFVYSMIFYTFRDPI